LSNNLIDEIRKALKGERKSEFIDQLLKEKELYDALKKTGITVEAEDTRERAVLRPYGVLSKVQKIDQIDVVELINKITEITTLKTLETLSEVTNIKNVESIDLIKRIGSINFANVSRSFVVNGSFESGDLTGWYRYPNSISQTNAYVTDESAYDGIYSLKYVCDGTPETATPEVDQIVGYIPVEEIDFIQCRMYAEVGTVLRFQAYYSDGASDTIDKTVTIEGWNTLTIKSSDFTAGKKLYQFSFYPAQKSENANKTFYLDAVIGFLRVQNAIYQKEKDRIVTQTTRTNLKTMGEREDLLLKSVDVTAGTTTILSAVSDQRHKIYGYDYEADADGTNEFLCTVNGTTCRFGRRTTKGVHAKSFVHPIVCDVDTALQFVSAGNTKLSIQYKTEA